MNRERGRIAERKWYQKNKAVKKQWVLNNPEKVRAINKRREEKPERKEYLRKWGLEREPRSGTHYPLDIRLAMEYVRIRDHNTCKWFGCGKTWKQTRIHVHHIFPINEYPELSARPDYMICYCHYHHWLWHEKRNDPYRNFIKRWNGLDAISYHDNVIPSVTTDNHVILK